MQRLRLHLPPSPFSQPTLDNIMQEPVNSFQPNEFQQGLFYLVRSVRSNGQKFVHVAAPNTSGVGKTTALVFLANTSPVSREGILIVTEAKESDLPNTKGTFMHPLSLKNAKGLHEYEIILADFSSLSHGDFVEAIKALNTKSNPNAFTLVLQ